MPDERIVETLLREHWPEALSGSALVIGPDAATIARLCAELSPQVEVAVEPHPDKTSADVTVDTAILHGALEILSRESGSALIARLRDVQCKHLLVTVRLGEGSPWDEPGLRALGLTRSAAAAIDAGTFALFEFSLPRLQNHAELVEQGSLGEPGQLGQVSLVTRWTDGSWTGSH